MTQASWPSSSVVNTLGHWSSWCCTIVSWGGVWCAVLTVELSLMPPKLPHSDFYTHKRNASFPSTDRWHLNRCLNLTRARSLPVPVFLLLRDGVTEQQSTLALDCGLSIRLNSSILMWRSPGVCPWSPVHCLPGPGFAMLTSAWPRLQDRTFECFVWPGLTLHSLHLLTRLMILDTCHVTQRRVTRLGSDSDPGMSRGMRPETEQTEYSHNFLSLFRLFSIWSLSDSGETAPARHAPPVTSR